MKKIIGALLLVCIFVGGYLLIPSNYYLRQTIVHLYPKIDQYPIFENRKVSAKDPQPWETADVYNKLSINPAYLPQFKKHGTVAFLVIQDSALVFEQYWEDYSDQKEHPAERDDRQS